MITAALPALINTKGTGHKLIKQNYIGESTFKTHAIFRQSAQCVAKFIKTVTKGPLSLAKAHTQEDLMKLYPMYVEFLRPHDYGKVPYVKFRPAMWENTGDIHRA